MPLAVGLVVVRLGRRLRCRTARSRVLLRPIRRRRRRIAVLLLRIALPLIARWTILRTVLLLLLRGRSILVLLRRILLILLRRILLLWTWIAVRIGIGI